MPKKYELLKDLPDYKAGEIFTYDGYKYYMAENYCSEGTKGKWPPLYVENNPSFFKEVIEKEWEIVAYHKTSYGRHCITTKRKNGLFLNDDDTAKDGQYSEPLWGNWRIHSVKRLSDSEVFSVGDEVEYKWSGDTWSKKVFDAKILSFKIDGVKMMAEILEKGYHDGDDEDGVIKKSMEHIRHKSTPTTPTSFQCPNCKMIYEFK